MYRDKNGVYLRQTVNRDNNPNLPEKAKFRYLSARCTGARHSIVRVPVCLPPADAESYIT